MIVSLYCLALMTTLFVPRHPATVLAGLVLVGYVYGCYGLMIGALWRRELESMFSVILLTNIDVGWLQNPVFYAEAESKTIIHWLPAYWPMQAAMSGAFTDHAPGFVGARRAGLRHAPPLHCDSGVLAAGSHGRSSHPAVDGGRADEKRSNGCRLSRRCWWPRSGGMTRWRDSGPRRGAWSGRKPTWPSRGSMKPLARRGQRRRRAGLTVDRRSRGEVAVLQPLRGAAWQGTRARLSGFLTATMSTGEAGLVAVINNDSRYTNYFPSRERIAKSEAGWRRLSVTLDVPADATLVSIGVWIRRGSGERLAGRRDVRGDSPRVGHGDRAAQVVAHDAKRHGQNRLGLPGGAQSTL